jgi:hypothetical protein
MTQPVMFDEQGTPTPEAQVSGAAAACSAEAFDKVDANRLRRLVEQEYKLFPNGATADEVVYRLQGMGLEVDELSIRPRVTELKSAAHGAVLVETGARRKNAKGNSCAILVHRDYAREAI